MLFYVSQFFEIMLLPPSINFVLFLIGIFLSKYKFISRFFISLSLVSLWLLSSPILSKPLVDSLQYRYQTLSIKKMPQENAAIVVLEAGVNLATPEYSRPIVSETTLLRLRYASFLQQQIRVPILVSGNNPIYASMNQTDYMRQALKEFFNTDAKWIEDRGYNTALEGIYATRILSAEGIKTIYLVTHAYHIPRSVLAFKNKGIQIIPAPTGYIDFDFPFGKLSYLLPSVSTLHKTSLALHEYIGIFWYQIFYKLK